MLQLRKIDGYDRLPTSARKRLEILQDIADRGRAISEGFNRQDDFLREREEHFRNSQAEEVAAHKRVGQMPSGERMAELAEDVAHWKDKRTKNSAAHTDHNKKWSPTWELVRENLPRSLSAALRQGVTFKVVPDPKLEGIPRDIVAKIREMSLAPANAERQLLREAEPDLASADAFVFDELTKHKVKGDRDLSYSSFGRKQELSLNRAVVTGPNLVGGDFVTVPDPTALLVSLHYDELLKRALANVRAHHAAYPNILRLSDAERQKRLSEVRRRVIAAERIEVAAIFAAHEAGDTIPFRAETSLEALLGVEIIRPKK